ncbi:hypothetical protein [Herbaspirillum seropedicae]|uniref:hypothetical protein n=1 Tax=Herbaspirillum seropedicae TaxID=964 RepID=UPI003FCEC940
MPIFISSPGLDDPLSLHYARINHQGRAIVQQETNAKNAEPPQKLRFTPPYAANLYYCAAKQQKKLCQAMSK